MRPGRAGGRSSAPAPASHRRFPSARGIQAGSSPPPASRTPAPLRRKSPARIHGSGGAGWHRAPTALPSRGCPVPLRAGCSTGGWGGGSGCAGAPGPAGRCVGRSVRRRGGAGLQTSLRARFRSALRTPFRAFRAATAALGTALSFIHRSRRALPAHSFTAARGRPVTVATAPAPAAPAARPPPPPRLRTHGAPAAPSTAGGAGPGRGDPPGAERQPGGVGRSPGGLPVPPPPLPCAQLRGVGTTRCARLQGPGAGVPRCLRGVAARGGGVFLAAGPPPGGAVLCRGVLSFARLRGTP